MNCNCSNNPCSCANANCGCPPNFTINPATLTCQGNICEDTQYTDCIFSTKALACVNTPINATLTTVLSAMDAKICQCGSCSGSTFVGLPLFYVDSNNTQAGNGSVGNPFQTIPLVYNAIIGSGTTVSPNFPNATVYVMGGNYTTSQNIYIPSTNWTFFNGARVHFTGQGQYFIDSAFASGNTEDFTVAGYIDFTTNTGGFLRNAASYTSFAKNKYISIEAYRIVGNTLGNTIPLISHSCHGGSGFSRNFTSIQMQSFGSFIASAQQSCIYYDGSTCYVNLNGARLYYGIDFTGGSVIGSAQGNIVNYNCTDGINPGASRFYLQNGFVASAYNTDMISMVGPYNFFKIENIKSESFNIQNPNTFLNINTPNTNLFQTNNYFQVLLENVHLDAASFNNANIIVYTFGGTKFNNLEMQNCILYPGVNVQFANIVLNFNVAGSAPDSGYNIINGNLNIVNLPTSSVGLSPGSIWKNANVLTIV